MDAQCQRDDIDGNTNTTTTTKHKQNNDDEYEEEEVEAFHCFSSVLIISIKWGIGDGGGDANFSGNASEE